jgi:hypothetical protein
MTTEHVCDLLSLTYMAFTLSPPGRCATDQLRAIAKSFLLDEAI